ncbi:SDR family oxidoreductase [Rhodococcus sp. MS16]|uniref:SDR family NAD(P)-dependent oxidoreductase n=1 Tax=Rhodococcus sp. MS16 TaxID=2579941 RepID=UPI001561D492|nr:SDR family oxidoreductase [Rhodococcus sp. MS16]
MSYFAGRVVVVTGAGAGIGRQLSLRLARQGALLSLIDRDQEALDETMKIIGIQGSSNLSSSIDVTNRTAMNDCAVETSEKFGGVDAVFNNAGILYSGDILDSEFTDIEHVMNVNFWGVVNGSKAFLPFIIRSDHGHIVNVSSAFGLMSAPGYAAYNSAKFAVRGFTESLYQEMQINHPQVKVTCAFPGGVKTSIARSARMAAALDRMSVIESFEKNIARTEPEFAARVIVRGVERGRSRILVGKDARLIDVVTRISSAGYQRILPALNSARSGQSTGRSSL